MSKHSAGIFINLYFRRWSFLKKKTKIQIQFNQIKNNLRYWWAYIHVSLWLNRRRGEKGRSKTVRNASMSFWLNLDMNISVVLFRSGRNRKRLRSKKDPEATYHREDWTTEEDGHRSQTAAEYGRGGTVIAMILPLKQVLWSIFSRAPSIHVCLVKAATGLNIYGTP